jgi:SAM-dependent methyltransferase
VAGPIDWGDGDYGRTAATLEPAARAVVDAAGVTAGEQVLDVGCGTGNAVLEAARRGAAVRGVDPAPELLAAARERLAAAGVAAELREGDAVALPVPDGAFDVVLSVFAVIFAPDAARAGGELLRAARPGGRVALTSWVPVGPVAEAGRLLMQAMGVPPAFDPPRWGDAGWVTELLRARGAASVDVAEHELAFTAASPAAWFGEQEEHHPAWRAGRRALGETRWERLRAQTVTVLGAANEEPSAFRTTSRYLLVLARRAGNGA